MPHPKCIYDTDCLCVINFDHLMASLVKVLGTSNYAAENRRKYAEKGIRLNAWEGLEEGPKLRQFLIHNREFLYCDECICKPK